MVYYYLFGVFLSLQSITDFHAGFLQFNGNFVDGEKNSQYSDYAPLSIRQNFSCFDLLPSVKKKEKS